MSIAHTVKTYLDKKGIDYEVVSHPRTYTSQQAAAQAHIADDHLAKGVMLKDGQGYLETVIPASHWIKLGAICDALERPLELAQEADFGPLFADCDTGAVPMVGQAYGVETVFDTALSSLGHVYFEAGDHEHLVHVNGEQFSKLMKGMRSGHFCQD